MQLKGLDLQWNSTDLANRLQTNFTTESCEKSPVNRHPVCISFQMSEVLENHLCLLQGVCVCALFKSRERESIGEKEREMCVLMSL